MNQDTNNTERKRLPLHSERFKSPENGGTEGGYKTIEGGEASGRAARLQLLIATISFIVAVAFAIAGFIVPPQGELHDSNLYLIAQFLLVTTSIFGVSAVVSTIGPHTLRMGHPLQSERAGGEA